MDAKWSIGACCAAILLAVCATAATRPARTPSNPIVRENALRGTTAWAVSPPPDAAAIAAYLSSPSAAPGERVALHVSTSPAARYRVAIYRLGWYHGAGGRLVGCLPTCETDQLGSPGELPPFDPSTGLVEPRWPVSSVLTVGRSWVSGYYLADAILTSGPDAGDGARVPFVVTSPPGRHSRILVQVPANTWEAYNAWGGRSLYYPNEYGAIDNHVSFERPYDKVPFGDTSPQRWELPLLRFLERNGYDVSYQTDLETDRDPASLLDHRLVVVAGHDEYWTHAIRLAFDHARDLGTNLAFMGANDGYWQIRYGDPARHTILEYRTAGQDPEPDPTLKTTRFRELDPPLPECELIGVQFSDSPHGQGGPFPYAVPPSPDPWLAKTGLSANESLNGMVGPEWDGPSTTCPARPSLRVLLAYGGPPTPAEAVRYTAASGARVFSTGSLDFNYALDDNRFLPAEAALASPDIQQLVVNALADLQRPAPPARVAVVVLGTRVRIAVPRPVDPRIRGIAVTSGGRVICTAHAFACSGRASTGRDRVYAVSFVDAWDRSLPALARAR